MGAENGIGRKFFDERGEFSRAGGAKFVSPLRQFSDEFRVVQFIENHSPKFRGVGDQFDVTIAVNFSVQRREETQQIDALDGVLRARQEPRFMEGGGSLEMAGAGSNRGDENAHRVGGFYVEMVVRQE
jgi:hypothetical protein